VARARAAQGKQQAVVGYLHSFSAAYMAPFEAALRQGLAEEGYAEPRNFRIEARSAEGQYDRLPALAQELVALKVDAIIAAGGSDPAKAAMAATSTIPIVFVSAADPIKAGIVQSLNRPGGNVTGVALIGSALEPKRLEYLSRLAPGGSPIGALVNPGYPDIELQVAEITRAAAAVNRPVEFVRAGTGQRSRRRLRPPHGWAAARSPWRRTRFLTAIAAASWRWPRNTGCRRSTISANMSSAAGWQATAPISGTATARPDSISAAS